MCKLGKSAGLLPDAQLRERGQVRRESKIGLESCDS